MSAGRSPMDLSRRLARIIGPTLVVLAITEWANLEFLVGNAPGVVYLNGTLLFAAGIGVVQAHNRWSLRWPLTVTMSGWAMLAGGLYRMTFPGGLQASRGLGTFILLVVILLFGMTMSWQGYRRR